MFRFLKTLAEDKSNPALQFIKYGLCGGVATLVDLIVFFVLATVVVQAVQPSDPLLVLWAGIHDQLVRFLPSLADTTWLASCFHFDLPVMDEDRRLVTFIIDKTIAFLFSNTTAYVTNVLWVFKAGRHSRRKEVFLFTAVSGTSYLVGLFLTYILIHHFGLPSSITYGALVVASVLINYVCRKYVIFKG